MARAGTTKPMIHCHFGSKEGLFAAVPEEVHAGLRRIKGALRLEDLPLREAMRRRVHVTFDCHAEYPDWVRLTSVANIALRRTAHPERNRLGALGCGQGKGPGHCRRSSMADGSMAEGRRET